MKATNETALAGNQGLTTTPRLRRTVMAVSHSTGPRTVAEIIGPDPARWLAAIMGLPVERVRAKLAEQETDLYRAYDDTGRLVYVGITKDFKRRLNEHRKNSFWHARARRFVVSTYPTREVALSVEAQCHDETPPQFGWCERSQYRPEYRDAKPIAEREVAVPEPVGMSF